MLPLSPSIFFVFTSEHLFPKGPATFGFFLAGALDNPVGFQSCFGDTHMQP